MHRNASRQLDQAQEVRHSFPEENKGEDTAECQRTSMNIVQGRAIGQQSQDMVQRQSRKPRLPLPVQGNCPLGCEKNMERRAESEPQSTGPEPTGLPYRLSRNDSHHMGNAECIRGSMFLEDGKDDKGKK